MDYLNDLLRIHEVLSEPCDETVNTSMRIPRNLRDAAHELVALTGEDLSVSAMTVDALRDRLMQLLQQAALDAHYEAHPASRPSPVDLAHIHARESGHALSDQQIDTAYQRLLEVDPSPSMDQIVGYALGLQDRVST